MCLLDWSDGQFFMAMEWRWLFFSSDEMAMVLKISHHHQWWFLVGSTIGNNGFSMVFEILRAMVNDGLEVNDGLHVPLHKKVRKINSRQNANSQH